MTQCTANVDVVSQKVTNVKWFAMMNPAEGRNKNMILLRGKLSARNLPLTLRRRNVWPRITILNPPPFYWRACQKSSHVYVR